MREAIRASLIIGVTVLLAGCTVHPAGEAEERKAAGVAGAPFTTRHEKRAVAVLPESPSADDLVRYALGNNADLEARYWEWRSAIEQIPQDGTQTTNLAVFGGLDITNGSTRLGNASLSVGNDPMSDIVLPPKLSAAARRALENARAAGLRFRKAQFELRGKVLNAYADYALQAELARLEEANAQLIETTTMAVEAKNRAGAAGQQDILKVQNELDLSRNDAANLRSLLAAAAAQLNALLGRAADAPLAPRTGLPSTRPIAADDATVLALVANRNPELAALAHEVSASKEGIGLARLQYVPDLSLTAGSDLAGVTQSLVGMVTVPVLRRQAIDAAVAQAEANIRARESMRRQTATDLARQVVMDLIIVRDADRQLELFERTILPRAERAIGIARSSYEAGQSSLSDLLDARRSLIAIKRLVANLRAVRVKRLTNLETVTARPLE